MYEDCTTVRVGELVPSITNPQVPPPEPVVTLRVAEVGDVAVNAPFITVVVPVTLLITATVDELVQFVFVPANVSNCGLERLENILNGLTVYVTGGGNTVVNVGELTPSITTIQLPVPAPVITPSVADVADVAVKVPAVTVVVPLTLLVIAMVEELVQFVFVPAKVSN